MKNPKLFSPPKNSKAKKFVNNKRRNTQEMYNTSEWSQYRFRFLYHNPQCYACGNPSKVVDHFRAAKGDKELFEKNDNHIPLCTEHHNFVTAKFDRNEDPDTVGKLKWLNEMRTTLKITTRVKVVPYGKKS